MTVVVAEHTLFGSADVPIASLFLITRPFAGIMN